MNVKEINFMFSKIRKLFEAQGSLNYLRKIHSYKVRQQSTTLEEQTLTGRTLIDVMAAGHGDADIATRLVGANREGSK
jgi:hypothetical protein